jgi:phosphoribosylformylglycinamidine (FGAM) synthase PurS component
MEVDAASESEARSKVEIACKKLLANPVIESFEFIVKKA